MTVSPDPVHGAQAMAAVANIARRVTTGEQPASSAAFHHTERAATLDEGMFLVFGLGHEAAAPRSVTWADGVGSQSSAHSLSLHDGEFASERDGDAGTGSSSSTEHPTQQTPRGLARERERELRRALHQRILEHLRLEEAFLSDMQERRSDIRGLSIAPSGTTPKSGTRTDADFDEQEEPVEPPQYIEELQRGVVIGRTMRTRYLGPATRLMAMIGFTGLILDLEGQRSVPTHQLHPRQAYGCVLHHPRVELPVHVIMFTQSIGVGELAVMAAPDVRRSVGNPGCCDMALTMLFELADPAIELPPINNAASAQRR